MEVDQVWMKNRRPQLIEEFQSVWKSQRNSHKEPGQAREPWLAMPVWSNEELGEDLLDQGYRVKAYADILDQSVWSKSMA